MRICFDLDNTLCVGWPYDIAKPVPGAAALLKRLKKKGHTVIIQTARGMGTANSVAGLAIKNIGLLTLRQLEEWGFEYDEIYFGKPDADVFVDDKAYHASMMKSLEKCIENRIEGRKSADCQSQKVQGKIDALISKIDKISGV